MIALAILTLVILCLAAGGWAHGRVLKAKIMAREIAPVDRAAGGWNGTGHEVQARFLANVSHEVRTPLAGILGMADLLAATEQSGEQAAYTEAIRSCAAALSTLIDEILDFSKISAGKLELEHQPLDLVALVEGVVELLAPRAQAKGLEIAALIAPDLPRHVLGDAARLRQVLINLVGNAVKFTQMGGIGIEVTLEGASIAFSVADTGCGVPEARRDAIFDEFEQATGALSQHMGGTGLGLAIARRIAIAMGGALELVHSDPHGSMFSCTLPLVPAATTKVGDHDVPALPDRATLIVAHSKFEAPYLCARLRDLGQDVVIMPDEATALARISRLPAPDIVIVDCALGEAITQAIVTSAIQTGIERVFVLFSPHERHAFGQSLALGAHGWLVKPLRNQSLLACLAMRPPSATSERCAATAPQPPVSTGILVLLAEDNDINALVAMRQLARLGARVTHCRDGLAALAQIRRSLLGENPAFDLVLMDLRMPGLDGRQVTREIRKLEAELSRAPLRIIALTADALSSNRTSCLAAGFDAFLVKPVNFEQLAEIVSGPTLALKTA